MSPALDDGRALAEELMVDTCTITRPATATLNETTGVYATTSTTIYTGKCRVRPAATDQQTAAGDRPTMQRQLTISVPITVVTAEVDDVVTITASPNDSGLVGLVAVVNGVTKGTQVTARRLDCVSVSN